MLTVKEFRMRARIDDVVLERWVSEGWLSPAENDGETVFTEVDVARVQLIHDLQHDLGVNEEGVGVILDLLDQLHGLRARMSEMMSVLQLLPREVRAKLVEDANRMRKQASTIPSADQKAP
jgi:chaperone modulatory protein CbpM